ncbi:collagen-like protein, partial [Bacillus tropicus]|nr:collagen-like protein [Bacillus tropicus]
GPTGSTGATGATGPTGATGTFSSANASIVTPAPQTVNNLAPIQFTAPVLISKNVTFNGIDTFTIQIPGNYFFIGAVMTSNNQAGPVAVGVGFNGIPVPSLDGANYGTPTGQEVVCFGFSGQIPAGTTINLYNISDKTISIGGATAAGSSIVAARLSFFRIS